jgi:hypothetical protein
MDEARCEIQQLTATLHAIPLDQLDIAGARALLVGEEHKLAQIRLPTDIDAQLAKLTESLLVEEGRLRQLTEESRALLLQSDARAQLGLQEEEHRLVEQGLADLKSELQDAFSSQLRGMSDFAEVAIKAKANLE